MLNLVSKCSFVLFLLCHSAIAGTATLRLSVPEASFIHVERPLYGLQYDIRPEIRNHILRVEGIAPEQPEQLLIFGQKLATDCETCLPLICFRSIYLSCGEVKKLSIEAQDFHHGSNENHLVAFPIAGAPEPVINPAPVIATPIQINNHPREQVSFGPGFEIIEAEVIYDAADNAQSVQLFRNGQAPAPVLQTETSYPGKWADKTIELSIRAQETDTNGKTTRLHRFDSIFYDIKLSPEDANGIIKSSTELFGSDKLPSELRTRLNAWILKQYATKPATPVTFQLVGDARFLPSRRILPIGQHITVTVVPALPAATKTPL